MLDEKAKDKDGELTDFNKALYQSFIMFLAMALCYPLDLIIRLVKRIKNGSSSTEEEVISPEEKHARRMKSLKVFSFV